MEATGALGAIAIYTALNMGVLFWLAVQTGRIRQQEKVLVGDGGNARLIRVMRGHANAVETIPMTLFAAALAALLGAPAVLIHAIGLVLTVGRVLHAWHFTARTGPLWQRMVGFGLTMLAMITAALAALVFGLWAL